jgi:hypothetical protein
VGEVVGGILDHAGVDGFLGNLEELRNAGQDTSQTDFLRAVHARHRSEPFMARSVIDLGVEYFHIGEGTDAELANRVGLPAARAGRPAARRARVAPRDEHAPGRQELGRRAGPRTCAEPRSIARIPRIRRSGLRICGEYGVCGA